MMTEEEDEKLKFFHCIVLLLYCYYIKISSLFLFSKFPTQSSSEFRNQTENLDVLVSNFDDCISNFGEYIILCADIQKQNNLQRILSYKRTNKRRKFALFHKVVDGPIVSVHFTLYMWNSLCLDIKYTEIEKYFANMFNHSIVWQSHVCYKIIILCKIVCHKIKKVQLLIIIQAFKK